MATEGNDSGEKRSTAKRTSRSRASEDGSANKRRASRGLGAGEVAKSAAQQLAELTGRAPEAVTSLSRTDDGWSVELDVVEIHRVPETADIIAVYRVDLDEDGQLTSYRRTARFVRSQVRED